MIQGEKIRLRACEPADLDMLYNWENNVNIWHVTNTYIPFSKNTLQKYLESVQDIYSDKQLRLIIEFNNIPVGIIDLFEYEPFHQRMGLGILIADEQNRNHGLATDAIHTMKVYCKKHLDLRILYCNVLENNPASLRLFEKCGFTVCGKKPEWHKVNGEYVNEYFLQVVL
ncbi:MAG TPA: GNAT family protein [Flavobacteriales bacterium]|nr:GNAT family protein [Flavobacteriales bacterium]